MITDARTHAQPQNRVPVVVTAVETNERTTAKYGAFGSRRMTLYFAGRIS